MCWSNASCFTILLFDVCEELILIEGDIEEWHGEVANPPHYCQSDIDPTQGKGDVSAGNNKSHLRLKHYILRSTGQDPTQRAGSRQLHNTNIFD